MITRTIALYLLSAAAVAFAQPAENESCRIRIDNRRGGLVQVSVDSGASWSCVGRVTMPANTRIIGFAAASYGAQGTVAATAVHGIRIKTGRFGSGPGKAQMPLIFSIVPREFAHIPQGYGGHVPRSSGILTDIHAGHSIFRNCAPYVGNRVYIERSGALAALPEDYSPVGGEVFVIVCIKPARAPREIVFENKPGGEVRASYADGSSEVIASVISPVRGVGRYDGTTFTGVGAINTNHGGVITVSTAPIHPPDTVEGGPVETRGGFMIQPSRHVSEQHEHAPQVMVVAPREASRPSLEGTAPLFDGCINLSWYPSRPECSMRAQVKIDSGDWQPMPEMVGKIDDALANVTAIRLLFPSYDGKLLASDIARETADHTQRAIASGVKPVRGEVTLRPKKTYKGKCIVSFLVDGRPICTSNDPPWRCHWDTMRVANGFHAITIEMRPESGEPVVEKSETLVLN